MGSNLTIFKGCTNPHIGCFTLIYYVAPIAGQKNRLQGGHGSLWLWLVMTLWPKFGCNMDLGCFGCATKMRSLARLGFILLLPLSKLWLKFDHMLDLVRSSCNLYPNCNKKLIISWTLFVLVATFFLTCNQNLIIGWTLEIIYFGCNPCLDYDQNLIIS